MQNNRQPPFSSATSCGFGLSLLLGLVLAAWTSTTLPSPAPTSSLPPPWIFGWGCPPCNQSECPPLACDEWLRYTDLCGCCSLCSKLEGDRCGGRGNAGGSCNESGLQCAYRLGSILGEERMGVCENSLCQRRLCGYRERCKVARDDKSVRKLCKCDYFRCDHKKNEVCGRDGHTYPSVCHLQRQECLSGHPIGIHHFNKCKPLPPKKKTSASPPVQCIHENEIYSPFHILPPSSRHPCTYHVCSASGHIEQYPVLGCAGNPPEEDWKVEEEVEPAGWTSWSPSSDCIGNCETGGVINWTRSCTNPPPSSFRMEADPRALYCEGEAEESRLCEPPGCNICEFSSWSRWTPCSRLEDCREGWQTRTRSTADNPTVPELCTATVENRTCQFIESCADCAMKTTKRFRVFNNETGCRSARTLSAEVCGGSCGRNKCCSNIYDENPFDYYAFKLFFTVRCPGDRGPRDQVFHLPVSCRCRRCDLVKPPEFMEPPWVVTFYP